MDALAGAIRNPVLCTVLAIELTVLMIAVIGMVQAFRYTSRGLIDSIGDTLRALRGSSEPRALLLGAVRDSEARAFERAHLDRLIDLGELLPPIGIIGTLVGLAVVVIAGGQPEQVTEGVLGALVTSILGLVGLVIVGAATRALNSRGLNSINRELRRAERSRDAEEGDS